jgi:hypothetical protein
MALESEMGMNTTDRAALGVLLATYGVETLLTELAMACDARAESAKRARDPSRAAELADTAQRLWSVAGAIEVNAP